MKMRIFLTAVLLCAVGFANFLLNAPGTLVLGETAGRQFDAIDVSYLTTQGVFGAFGVANWLLSVGCLIGLMLIWLKPIRALIASMTLTILIVPQPASAYYADSDYAETFMILPNESAFWLPDVGNNKDSQVQFGSEQYYAANKIAAKRFDVTTHVRLPNSGIFANKYVSPGRLIKVDRSPTTREWVLAAHKGTGQSDESFPCQDNAGHDITTGVSIGTYVTEEDAPKFLYHYGVNPPKGDPNDPNVVFTSVYYGRSLAQVMDEKIRNKVQSMVCTAMTKHGLDDDNLHADEIMQGIEKDVRTYLTANGITLDFIGWADTFHFSPEVQAAIDRAYIAKKDLEVAAALAPYAGTLQALATAEGTRTVANKWNGALPSSVSLWWLPASVSDWLTKPMAPGK
jgi:hypothetical protein